MFLWPLTPVQNPYKKPVLSHRSQISIIIKSLGIYIIYQFYPIDLIAKKMLAISRNQSHPTRSKMRLHWR